MFNNKPSTTTPTPAPTTKKGGWVKYLFIMLGFGVLGAIFGFAVSFMRDNLGAATRAVVLWVGTILPYLQWVAFLLCAGAALVAFALSRRRVVAFEKSGCENETLSEQGDQLLNFALLFSSLGMILTYLLFGFGVTLRKEPLFLLNSLVLILLTVVFVSAFNVHSIKLAKRLNPEKQGDPLSTTFQKDWLASMDEAERSQMYQAAWVSYKATNIALIICWLTAVFCGLLGEIGVLPILLVSILWLTHTMSYLISCIRQCKGKPKR